MRKEIERWLQANVSLMSRPSKALKLAHEHFGGTIWRARYLEIDGVCYKIVKNMDAINWTVETMSWDHGHDFIYCKPY